MAYYVQIFHIFPTCVLIFESKHVATSLNFVAEYRLNEAVDEVWR